MKKSELVVHILLCVLIGGAISYFTPAKWIAAAFWVSAAMNLQGAIAIYEDAVPGGFNNPAETPEFTKGVGAAKYFSSALAVAGALAVVGLIFQWYL